ncbi:hypothetical protein PanWU01x14_165670 [Parasponia andersonii]|uniref:Uncharacterized protein n=1 Tax=Parasponia andersonii TaxID=3476 RepID=A0A2P5CBU9_PARAD|nr:hypothetical protein PanWU01x14_165670 [Parasponia andersonii]
MLPKYYAPTLSRISVALQNKRLLTVEGCVPHRVLKTDSLPPPECLRICKRQSPRIQRRRAAGEAPTPPLYELDSFELKHTRTLARKTEELKNT